jgi:hypothetical protein
MCVIIYFIQQNDRFKNLKTFCLIAMTDKRLALGRVIRQKYRL